jgi:hypothetical protein
MLGDGMLELGELGELGGGELLLDEQPASASAALSSSTGMPPFTVLPECPFVSVAEFIRSAPCCGPWRRQQARRSPKV